MHEVHDPLTNAPEATAAPAPADPLDSPGPGELLRLLLAGRDVDCPVCGYNLRGATSECCAECGAAIELRVGSADLRMGPWLMSVLSMAIPVGFVGMYTVLRGLMIGFWLFAGNGGLPATYMLYAICLPFLATVAYALMLARTIRRRRLFWRCPREMQWRIATLHLLAGPLLVLAAVTALWIGPMLLF